MEVTPDHIRQQVDRICASREFRATARQRAMLRFCVEEALAGHEARLKGYTIAIQVFDRGPDFDAARDPVVRIQAGRLRQALERYYLVAGSQDAVFIDLPKGGYVPVFARQQVAVEIHSIEAEGAGSSPAVVAVLPLEDLSPDPSWSFLAAGLAEELASELSLYQDLEVLPCHRDPQAAVSPRQLTGRCRDAGARFLLGGSVRRDADAVKICAWLIDSRDGHQIWTRSFKRGTEAAGLIATQEEIAAEVVAALGSELGVIPQRLAEEARGKRPCELSTFEAMLAFHAYQVGPSPAAAGRCFEALHAAVEREPDYGAAWSALATLYCQMHIFDAPGFDDPLHQGVAYARRGAALDPKRQLSRLILAYSSLLEGSLDAFRREAERSVDLNPNNPYTVGAVGYLRSFVGEFEVGCAMVDRAIERCPIHPPWFHHAHYMARFHAGDHQGALDALSADGDAQPWQPALVAAALGKLGRQEESARSRAWLLEVKPDFPARARIIVERSLKCPELVDELVDGLRRAGVAAEAG